MSQESSRHSGASPEGMKGSRHLFYDRKTRTRIHLNPRRGCAEGKPEQALQRAFSWGSSCETRQAGADGVTRPRRNVTAQETLATQPQNRNHGQKTNSLLPARIPLLASAAAVRPQLPGLS